jgi:uncharacterized protein with von Willebrand factor type A (vWA) domain
LLFLSFALIGCGQSSNTTSNSESTSQSDIANTYSQRGADNSWPSFVNKTMSISDNLLTKNYYLIVDGSGSMDKSKCSGNKSKMSVAKDALSTFISKLPSDSNIGLFVFDHNGIREEIPLTSNNKQRALSSISNIKAGGSTPLGRSIYKGYDSLTKQAQTQLGYGEFNMVVVTDGFASDTDDLNDIVRTLLKDSPITLHTIGFCIDDSHTLNLTGYTMYKSANNQDELLAGLDSVLAEAPDFQISNFAE